MPKKKSTFIYALTDPLTHELFYVGKSDDPKKRLSGHIHTAKGYFRIPELYVKIKELLDSSLKPNLMLLEEVSHSDWDGKEREYIALYKERGYTLLNSTDGGKVFKNDCVTNSAILQSKPILQYSSEGDFIREWPSIREAARSIGAAKSTLYCSLNTKHKTGKGCIWRYKLRGEIPKKVNVVARTWTTKPVFQILPDGTEVKFNSIRDAAHKNNLKETVLSQYIAKNKPYKGLVFRKDLDHKRWKEKHGKLNQKLVNYSYIDLDDQLNR